MRKANLAPSSNAGRRRVLRALALLWLLAQPKSAQADDLGIGPPGAAKATIDLSIEDWRQKRLELQQLFDERPHFVLPLVITVSGAGVAVGSLYIGALGMLGDCEGPCHKSIGDVFLVVAAIGGGIAALSGIWLTERLIARRAHTHKYNALQRELYGGTSVSQPALASFALTWTF